MFKLPKVAIIGRANVGKSTLFNKLTEQKKAIVSNISGTTRDRHYCNFLWRGANFTLIDTGGIDLVHDQAFFKDVIKQATFALKEADLILFMVDVKNGLMPQDKEVGKLLKKNKKPIILVANKADNLRLKKQVDEFYKLGLGEPVPISALNGSGTGDLLDVVVENLKLKTENFLRFHSRQVKLKAENLSPSINVAIIGKPNVGKSSIVNAILGEERVIVSPTPYTTRDAQDIDLTYKKQPYTLIDTAGIRKQSKIKNKLERYSVGQAVDSIKRADITLLITDVSQALGKQDKHLSDVILQSAASLIIIANKWDLIEKKDEKTINKFIKYYQQFFPYLAFAPIIFTSAIEKQRMKKILDVVKEVYDERFKEISENALEEFLTTLLKKQPPAKGKGIKKPRIYGLKQLAVDPPSFELVKDFKSDLHISYVRFMENQLRQKFGFLGTPVIIRVRVIR